MKTLNKNAQGYGYKYTDLAEIHRYLELNEIEYIQYIEPEFTDGEIVDYVMTVPIIDGERKDPIRGCRVIRADLDGKKNPAQEYGSALTYARRYSLLMAFGLATADDDAQRLTEYKGFIGEEKAKDLLDEILSAGKSPDYICRYYKVATLSELTDDQLIKVREYLKK